MFLERKEGLHRAFCEASGCSVVVGGPLDPDNHFDRALVAGEVMDSYICFVDL